MATHADLDSYYRILSPMMKTIIQLPESIEAAIKIPKHRLNAELRKELALQLYRERLVSFAHAQQIAEISKIEFHHLLGERQIPRHYDDSDLDDDMETLANL